jgi:hypothetical protein
MLSWITVISAFCILKSLFERLFRKTDSRLLSARDEFPVPLSLPPAFLVEEQPESIIETNKSI